MFDRNVDALRLRQPELAARLSATPLPEGIQLATGRDGTRTYRLPANGGFVWLGGSSTPTLSAEAIASDLPDAQSSLTIPGVFTGLELVRLLECMPPHSALFVIEHDWTAMALVLRLYDYSGAISSGRLVLIPGADLDEDWQGFFRRNPGYELPRKFLQVPQLSAAQLSDIQARVERGTTSVAAFQGEQLSATAERLRAARPAPVGDETRIVVLSAGGGAAQLDTMHRIEAACAACGWSGTVLTPDRPDMCHPLAQLRAIEQAAPHAVVVVEASPSGLRSLLPDHLPIIVWQTGERPCVASGTKWAARDMWLVPSTAARVAALEAGGAPAHTHVIEPAAHDTLCQPGSSPAQRSDNVGAFLIVADLPETRPDKLGLNLPSQRSLFAAMATLVDRAVRGGESLPDVGAILAHAEKSCGTTLTEESLRGVFRNMLTFCVIPVARCRAAAASLASTGTQAHTAGRGWLQDAAPGTTHIGPAAGQVLRPRLAEYRGILFPLPGPALLPVALDALLLGTAVGMTGTHEEFVAEYPSLHDIAPYIRFLDDHAAPGEWAKEAGLRGARRPPTGAGAAEVIKRRHLISHRLEQMRTLLAL